MILSFQRVNDITVKAKQRADEARARRTACLQAEVTKDSRYVRAYLLGAQHQAERNYADLLEGLTR